MRLTALSLTKYGNFETERVTFDPRPGVLNLLMAPNGAGKSVLRSAFCDLLFGIGGQTPMGFRYGYPGMRLLADAIGADGTPFSFGRRKGQGNTLLDAAGEPLDPGLVARHLGRTDRTLLERLFALDTERLRQGEDALFASDGALAEALESGAGGFQHVRRLRKQLEDTRDSLAPTRRSAQRPFYKALDAFVAARKQVGASLIRPDQWHRQQQEHDAAQAQQAAQNALAEAASADIARLERIRRVTPWLAAHDAAAGWLAAHPDAPVLDPALAARLADARAAIVMATQRRDREQAAVLRLGEQLAAIQVDAALLAEAEELDRLIEAAGAARKAAADLPGVASQAAARQATVAACLRDLGSDLPVDRAAEAVPPRAAVNQARRLLQGHTARLEAVQGMPARIAGVRQQLADLQAQLAALPIEDDLSALQALLREIRAEGEPQRRQREVAAAVRETAEALAAALARVPGWTQDAETLAALVVLPLEIYERSEHDQLVAQREADDWRQRVAEAGAACDEARERQAAATGTAPLPDEARLAQARARRDTGWQLIYRRAFTADPPPPQEEQAFAGPLPLPIAYERAVTAADDVADRRVQEAAAIERAQAAGRTLQEAEARLAAATARLRLVEETRQAAVRAWTQLTSPLPLGAAPPLAAVRSFLAARERTIEARQAAAIAVAASRLLAEQHAAWQARLLAALGEAAAAAERLAHSGAVPAPDPAGTVASTAGAAGDSLPDLLAAADRRLAAAQRAGKQRAALEASRAAAAAALAEAESRQREADAALAGWQAEWDRARRALGRPEAEDPRATADVLDVLRDLDVAAKEAASLAERVTGMTRDNQRFAGDVAALALRLSPDSERAADPFAAAAALRLRLQQAREQAKQRGVLTEQWQAAREAADAAARQLAEADDAQRAVLLLIGADSVAAAEQRLALAAERAGHVAARDAAAAELRAAGDGLPIDTVRAEVGKVPADEIAGRIERAAAARAAAQEAAQAAASTASALAQRLAQAAADTGAADAAADQAAAVATIGRVLEEALVHHLAADMLERALAAMETAGESKLLRRIGALFTTLTDGAYARVLTERDDADVCRITLLQRDFPDERQSVRELSEGTRDQLFLALRLAAIEEHAASAPPLPFIGDDILQTFDDDRAVAAMRVLQEVSETVQVILLTHHRHLLQLAGRLPAGTVHVCRIGAPALTDVA